MRELRTVAEALHGVVLCTEVENLRGPKTSRVGRVGARIWPVEEGRQMFQSEGLEGLGSDPLLPSVCHGVRGPCPQHAPCRSLQIIHDLCKIARFLGVGGDSEISTVQTPAPSTQILQSREMGEFTRRETGKICL